MSSYLIFTEIDKHGPKAVTLEILSHLKDKSPDVVAIGNLSEKAAKELSAYHAQHLYSLQSDALTAYSPDGYASALAQLIKEKKYKYILAGATSMGKDFFPRLAAKFGTGLISDATGLTVEGDRLSATRPFFSGKCLADAVFNGEGPHFITLRPNALGKKNIPLADAVKPVETVKSQVTDIKALVKEIVKGTSEKLDLTEANIIVSGGRAMKNAENFKILHELAEVLGATVGASRAAVDSGYADPSMQVGQTGKTVSPTLYISCGISGAIQHLAGMRTSKVILAINMDPDAPIFSVADYGIVGDLFKIVPLLTEEFKKFLNK